MKLSIRSFVYISKYFNVREDPEMKELREFYYHDSRLTANFLSQIEDGLIQYKLEDMDKHSPNHSFEISTGALVEVLQSFLGIPVPDLSFAREGKSVTVKTSEIKAHDKVSQFSRLSNYLEPILPELDSSFTIDDWNSLLPNQFLKFRCTIKLSSLYMFSDFTRRLGGASLFYNQSNDPTFSSYVQHAELIESKRKHKFILKPDFLSNSPKHYFVSEIQKSFLEEGIELTDLNNEEFIVFGRIERKLAPSEKEIIFDLTETGILEVMRSKEIKKFIEAFNKNASNPLTNKFRATVDDVYATRPTILFRPLAIYKA